MSSRFFTPVDLPDVSSPELQKSEPPQSPAYVVNNDQMSEKLRNRQIDSEMTQFHAELMRMIQEVQCGRSPFVAHAIQMSRGTGVLEAVARMAQAPSKESISEALGVIQSDIGRRFAQETIKSLTSGSYSELEKLWKGAAS